MSFLPVPPRRWRMIAPAAVGCALAGWLFSASAARAQQQEKGFLDRLDHPDRTLHYSPGDKAFSASSSVNGKQATIHSFTFKGGGAFQTGTGAFNVHSFNGVEKYRTQSYATKAARGTEQGFMQTDKTYGTKTVAVKEDRAANQTAAVRDYAPASKAFLGRGRRQDSIDDLRNQKNLTIDQVREILNKNK